MSGLGKRMGCSCSAIRGSESDRRIFRGFFEWGYTGYNGRLDKRSTGVGLALVKQVMEMLGNKMEIRSVLGEGTEVFLDLRRTELEAE